ncbi:hypothetical protein C4D60_Mb07t06710 [Musa balbisiana]|uniref:B box-type domain-containing protein n=1 Tax=Musa balbisiana TaxID=52838 RepID=A0A4S8JDF8_MUSBA|nr:hypothetical protein C4D60_Mb07t06710 [Musa balbisiana]
MFRLGNEDMGPPWLRPLLKTSFFTHCEVHGDSNKSECNMYCLDCMGNALCSYCLPDHKDHHVVQWMHGSESDESSTPRKVRKTLAFGRSIEVPAASAAGSEGGSISPGTPPILSYRTSRRKGIPHRAPF